VTKPQHPRRSRDIKCLGHGHIALECPNRRVMILYEDHDANLVITWSRNPQSRLRSDPGKPK